MPTQEERVATQPKNEQENAEETSQFLPGQLVPQDAVAEEDRIDIGADEEKKNCLKNLAERVAQRDLVSRRLEVRDAWKSRYFWRGNQHLLLGRNGAWVLPQMVLMGGQSFDDHSNETNIYLAFGNTIVSALTAGVPSVRFEEEDPNNAADIAASEGAEKGRLLIERNNNVIVVQEDEARFLWTDGRACRYTRFVHDSQRFGWTIPEQEQIQDEISLLPESTEPSPETQSESAETGAPAQGEPRGQEVIEVYGVLETKLPIQANSINQSAYLQFSYETDITTAKSMYPDKASDIKPAQSPTAESNYERLARTSIMMGMRPSNMTSDSMTYNATIQKTWVRPSFFMEEKDETLRQWLFDTFPKGCMMVMCGEVLCEQRNESMDDHWTLVHAFPGDGMHRPALGTPLIPLQEKLNDCMDLTHESFMHLIPRIWVDPSIDTAGLSDTKRAPGQYFKAPKPQTGKAIADSFFTEQQIEIASGLMDYIKFLFGEGPQFLTGAFPALFGGNTGSNDTASGIASQRDQALGRIGLTWRNIKAGHANCIKQALTAAADFRKEVMSGEIPGEGGQFQRIALDPNDLKGNILCFPDTDENFPESWVAKRAVWNQVIEMSAKNPVLGQILSVPRNMRLAKDKAGLPELVIPGADSSEKQLGEIALLLQGTPVPNPQLQQAQEQEMQQAQAMQASGQTVPPEAVAEAQQALQSIPPLVSSVPIDVDLDNHQAEADEIKTWANSPEGIKAKAENPDGFQNVLLHYKEHMAQLKPQGQAEKPPAESINFKDLPVDGQVQLAAKGGITLDANKMQAEEQQDKQLEAAAKAKPPMIQ